MRKSLFIKNKRSNSVCFYNIHALFDILKLNIVIGLTSNQQFIALE